jgi:hypothetical protein
MILLPHPFALLIIRCFLVVQGIELRTYTLRWSISSFLWWVSRTIFPGWLWALILLISAS